MWHWAMWIPQKNPNCLQQSREIETTASQIGLRCETECNRVGKDWFYVNILDISKKRNIKVDYQSGSIFIWAT